MDADKLYTFILLMVKQLRLQQKLMPIGCFQNAENFNEKE